MASTQTMGSWRFFKIADVHHAAEVCAPTVGGLEMALNGCGGVLIATIHLSPRLWNLLNAGLLFSPVFSNDMLE